MNIMVNRRQDSANNCGQTQDPAPSSSSSYQGPSYACWVWQVVHRTFVRKSLPVDSLDKTGQFPENCLVDSLKMHQGKAELVNNKYSFLESSFLDPLYKSRKKSGQIRQPGKQADRQDPFP